jgi:hypothetical protein
MTRTLVLGMTAVALSAGVSTRLQIRTENQNGS